MKTFLSAFLNNIPSTICLSMHKLGFKTFRDKFRVIMQAHRAENIKNERVFWFSKIVINVVEILDELNLDKDYEELEEKQNWASQQIVRKPCLQLVVR